MRHLRHRYHQQAIGGVAMRDLLSTTLSRFAEVSVPVIVLDGAALAALVYPSPSLRPLGHVALLVRGRDADRADELMQRMRAAQRTIPFLGPDGYSRLTIRDDIDGPSGTSDQRTRAGRIPLEDLWNRARIARIESVQALVLSPQDLVMRLALHVSNRDPFVGQMLTVCDLAETCRRYADAIDWARLASHAGAYQLSQELTQSLHLAHDLLGAAVPSELLAQPSTIQPLAPRLTPVSRDVAVTYDQGGTDGVGAQLARVYGLYALTRALGVRYVHTPLGQVSYQGLMPLLAGRIDPDFAARYNAFFTLPSDEFDASGCETVRLHSPLDEHTLERFREHAAVIGRPVLLRAHDAYAYLDRHPAAYRILAWVSPYRGYQATGPVRVCIHLRRGDMLPDGRSRWLPNSYYLRSCAAVVEALHQQGASFSVRLHSEMPPELVTLNPDTPGLYIALDRPTIIDPDRYALEDFDALPNLERVFNVEPRQVLDDFATADVLILSRSDLGFVGGLLNTHGLIIAVPSYHTPPPNWLVADERGDLDRAQVAHRIADLVRSRATGGRASG
jgi:hypothetical protein